MLRLSWIFKPRLRPWIAVASAGFVLAMLVVACLEFRRRGDLPWMLVGVSIPLVGGLVASLRNGFLTRMVDEAWVEGDELLLRRAGLSIRVSLAHIAAVDVATGGLATLELSMPCTMGSRIRFIASKASRGEMEAQLRRRIEDARRRRE